MPDNDKEIIKWISMPATRERGYITIVENYQKRLYWHIRKMVISHEDADDVLQNTFIKVWRNLSNFRGDSKIYTWLYRIATNEAITHINYEKKRLSSSIDTEEDYFKLKSDSYFDGDTAENKLLKAIEMLPQKQKTVFKLKYFQEMKYEDMSEVLETSVGALKASYHHAVNKIKSYLEDH